MDSDLLATCNALGYLEDDRYFKEPDCIDTVKCLIRFLHSEDNNHEIRIQLGAGHIVRNDLLPILRQYPDDDALCAAVLRLLVNLTQPALLCYGNKIPTEIDQYHNYLDILSHSQEYKENFSNDETWKVLAQKVYDILEKDWEDRSPDDSITVERILVLCRNLLHVPPTTEDDNQTADNMSTHDRLVIALHTSGIDSMVLYLASSTTEQQWCLHVAEIISLLLKEQNVDALIGMNNAQERERQGDELKQLRLQEEKRRQMRKLQQSSRHSRFGGTYVAKGKSALADNNELVIHKSLQKCSNLTYDEGKNKLRKAKHRRPLIDGNVKRRSTLEVRKILKEFCIGLLNNGYNHLMFNVKDKLSRENSDEHDETYYFSIMSFIMEFNRKHEFHIDLVSETMQLPTLHFIDISIVNCMELMMTDKQESKTWGRRMHLALQGYKEFLLTVQTMQSSKNETVAESAKVLLNNIFYTPEYREIFLTLLRKYDESKLSHGFLDDLIQTTHLFIRLFENYCKGSNIVVQKKKVKRKTKKKKRSTTTAASDSNTLTDEEKTIRWSEIEEDVKTTLQNGDLPEAGPVSDLFDPTSDVPEEEQQQKALVKIQNKLHSRTIPEAVVILKQARELWPEIDIFGTSVSTWEDDVSTLKEICLADMTGLATDNQESENQEEEQDEEEEEESIQTSSREVEFNLTDYLKKFSDYKVVQPYVILLAKFKTNSQHTNHCIVKLLHRVCYDLKMYGLLFQASVFRCFQKIFKCALLDPTMRELDQFAKFIVQKFFEVLPKNDKLFAEILFWKQTNAHVYELVEGYGSFSNASGSKKPVVWSEAEKEELANLYDEFKDGELDVVDCILARITDESRARRQVVSQLLNLGIANDAAELKRKKGPRPTVWREDEEMELRRLFEEYQNSDDRLGNIMQMMTCKKSKGKVIEKLLAMGLVQDRKELHKRRKRAEGSSKNKEYAIMHAGGSDDSENEDAVNRNDDSESDDDDSWALIDLQSCIRKASSDGFSSQIDWVKSSLNQAIDDRSNANPDEEIQAVPLVPLMEEQEDAMQNSAFRKMLRFIGLHKPSTGQEMFWRIPPDLTVGGLQESVQILSQPVKRKRDSSPERIESAEDVLKRVQEESDDEELSQQSKRKRRNTSDEDDDEVGKSRNEINRPTDDSEDVEKDLVQSKNRKRILLDDSDEDSDAISQDSANAVVMNTLQSNSEIPEDEDVNDVIQPKSKRMVMSDDSDEDDKENQDLPNNDNNSSSKNSEEMEISFQRKNRKRISVMEDDDDDF
uniref:protein timeless homolog n=1 Tax=Styela clava TaxID=7725 RepID=UPI001939D1BD|nr:protein timeless homolog [Styela clava]